MRHFSRFAAAALLALSLGGCAAGFGERLAAITSIATLDIRNPVAPADLASVEAAYGIALAAAVAYRERYDAGHRCTTISLESASNLCSRRSIVVKLQAADLKAQEAIAAARAFIARNPTLNARAAIDAAQTAVAAYRKLAAR